MKVARHVVCGLPWFIFQRERRAVTVNFEIRLGSNVSDIVHKLILVLLSERDAVLKVCRLMVVVKHS